MGILLIEDWWIIKNKVPHCKNLFECQKKTIYYTEKKKMKYCNANYLFECQDIWYISTNVNC